MAKWQSETGAYGTCYWLKMADNIEISLMKRNTGRSDLYQYSFKWGYDGGFLDCHWTENLTAESLIQAKAKATMRTRAIITNYIRELNEALEVFWEMEYDEGETGTVGR